MTAILGISAFYHDSAAALVVNGEIVAAAQEERWTRKKHDHEFPGQDKPFIEDLGRRARQFVVRGYVIGVNYLLSKDALTAQCEKPGIGLLVHTSLGLPGGGEKSLAAA